MIIQDYTWSHLNKLLEQHLILANQMDVLPGWGGMGRTCHYVSLLFHTPTSSSWLKSACSRQAATARWAKSVKSGVGEGSKKGVVGHGQKGIQEELGGSENRGIKTWWICA